MNARAIETQQSALWPPWPGGVRGRLEFRPVSEHAPSSSRPAPAGTGNAVLVQEARRQARVLRLPRPAPDLVGWIREWLKTPDDRGDEWWASFEDELFERRPAFRHFDA